MVSRMLNLRRTVNIGSERDFVDLRPVNILARYNRGNGNNFLGISRDSRGNETIRKPRKMYKIIIAVLSCQYVLNKTGWIKYCQLSWNHLANTENSWCRKMMKGQNWFINKNEENWSSRVKQSWSQFLKRCRTAVFTARCCHRRCRQQRAHLDDPPTW